MIGHLPAVLFHQILHHLPVHALFHISLTCHTLYSDIEDYLRKKNIKIMSKYYPTLSTDPFYIQPRSPFQHQHELLKDRIIVVRGFLTYSMDTKNQKWKRCHDSRRDRGYFAAVNFKGDIYAIGTYSLVAAGTVERYNPLTDFWHLVNPIPRKLRSVGAAVLGGESLYVTGGIESFTDIVTDRIYLFDFEKNEENLKQKITNDVSCWRDCGVSLLRPRYRHAAVAYQGKIWIAGGTFENSEITNSVEIYDSQVGSVIQGPSMLARRDFTNLLIVKEELYAVGGDVDDAGQPIIRTIEKYDANCNQWTYIASFKDTRRGFSTCAFGSKIFVFCGSNDTQHHLRNWDAFDVDTKVWQSDLDPSLSSRQMPLIDNWGQATTFPGVNITLDDC